MTKYEWKKQDKALYIPGQKPVLIDVPEMQYFTIQGKGDPNGEVFKVHVEALYAMSYAIRMMPKQGVTPEGYFEYTVFPLEGHWDLDEEGRKLDYLDKKHLVYTLMIRQPSFITEELFGWALEQVQRKKKQINVEAVRFEKITEGPCVQAMHIGSYDNEPETFALMEQYCAEQQLRRAEKTHKEIYLSDARKTVPEKLKTVLRFRVERDI
ncbi:GyrI-like domain-containing protein [Paenibacillus sp. FSL R10-2734]|uniref:GyrI-like domain-containing protein n=1 Tax=Paenibacillus sp. FSL R10-2734 TaxID=2954691 RepID=UPI0030DDB016